MPELTDKKNDRKAITNALRLIDGLLLALSILLGILFFLTYYFAENIFRSIEQRTVDLIKDLMVGFLSVVFPFVTSYFVLRKVQELKANQAQTDLINDISSAILPEIRNCFAQPNQNYELVEFDKIKWEELLSDARNVDIFVHYFDTWMRNNSESLKGIFSRNGTIRIIIPSVKNKNLVKTIKQRFPEYNENQIKEKINGTKGKLCEYKNGINQGILETYETSELGYYCGIKIDEKYFIYSSYEHIRTDRKILGPTFIIRIDKEPKLNEWFTKEFANLPKEKII